MCSPHQKDVSATNLRQTSQYGSQLQSYSIHDSRNLLQIVFNGSFYIFRIYIENSITTQHPFFLGYIVVTYLSCKLEDTLKYPSVYRCQTNKTESE